MSGTWTSNLSYRADSENFLSGVDSGTYNGMQKISEAIATTGNSLTGLAPVTVANLQSFWLQSDQDCDVVFTLGTGSKTIALTAGNGYLWSVNSGQANPFAYNIVSAVVNFSGTAPTITARIAVT